jgi:DNA polymerase III alpha subunit (gram-positive type)
MKYVCFDVETGGTDASKVSLLEAAFVVIDSYTREKQSLILKIKPDDDIYHVQAEGLGINKINLVEHDKVAITESKAKTVLFDFLKMHSNNGKDKLAPLGHNVKFDIDFIQAYLLTKNTWNMFVLYRPRDTSTLGTMLKDAELIPENVKGSLESYAAFFGLTGYDYHTAMGDVDCTIDVYFKMMEMVKR